MAGASGVRGKTDDSDGFGVAEELGEGVREGRGVVRKMEEHGDWMAAVVERIEEIGNWGRKGKIENARLKRKEKRLEAEGTGKSTCAAKANPSTDLKVGHYKCQRG
jgi:hypothetical protein